MACGRIVYAWLILLCGGLVWAGTWRCVRIGPPQTELIDAMIPVASALAAGTLRPKPAKGNTCPFTPDDYQRLQNAIAEVALINGLELDRNTRTDGNCGPDTILRNLEHMASLNKRGQEALQILKTKGRDQALAFIRKSLVSWIWAHPQVQILPSTTITDIVIMEGVHRTLSDYCGTMGKPFEWIDTPMLWAASAVFECQLVMFMGSGEPQLLVAPSVAGRSTLPVMSVASVNNVHFMALRPAGGKAGVFATDGEGAYRTGNGELSSVVGQSCSDSDEVLGQLLDDEACGELLVFDADADARRQRCDALFGFCGALAKWSAFTAEGQCGDVLDALRSLEGQDQWNIQGNTFQVLQWREVIKQLQWEGLDKLQGLNREVQHQCARLWRAARDDRQGMHKAYTKSRRLYDKLSPTHIECCLERPCETHGNSHRCLQVFRANPLLVLRWRKMWYSLPKVDRERRLCEMVASQRAAHGVQHLGDHEGFHIDYAVLGIPMCRNAFIAVTAIYADTIQRARQNSINSLPNIRDEMGGGIVPASLSAQSLGIWVSRRPLAYTDARSWLLSYAKSHGDTSPLNDKYYLPTGQRCFYYASYLNDRLSKGVDIRHVASKPWFLQMWRVELPWVIPREASGLFTKCGLCEYLKMLATNAKDPAVRKCILQRLGCHYDFQAAQRNALDNIFRESERDPTELLAFGWDKMDQAKTVLPRVNSLTDTSFVKHGKRLVVSLIGVMCPALWKQPLVYTAFENCKHGGNMIGSLMVLMNIKSVVGVSFTCLAWATKNRNVTLLYGFGSGGLFKTVTTCVENSQKPFATPSFNSPPSRTRKNNVNISFASLCSRGASPKSKTRKPNTPTNPQK